MSQWVGWIVEVNGDRVLSRGQIDRTEGYVAKKIGDYAKKGEALLTIHANDERKLTDARRRLLDAYSWSDEPVERPPLIHKIIQ